MTLATIPNLSATAASFFSSHFGTRPTQRTTRSNFENHGGSKLHIYRIAPGYFLSAYVLGCAHGGRCRDRLIRIEPRPGDLSHATGEVVTEFGPVNIAWKRAPTAAMSLQFNVPANCRAMPRLPKWRESARMQVNGREIEVSTDDRGKLSLPLKSGSYDVLQVD